MSVNKPEVLPSIDCSISETLHKESSNQLTSETSTKCLRHVHEIPFCDITPNIDASIRQTSKPVIRESIVSVVSAPSLCVTAALTQHNRPTKFSHGLCSVTGLITNSSQFQNRNRGLRASQSNCPFQITNNAVGHASDTISPSEFPGSQRITEQTPSSQGLCIASYQSREVLPNPDEHAGLWRVSNHLPCAIPFGIKSCLKLPAQLPKLHFPGPTDSYEIPRLPSLFSSSRLPRSSQNIISNIPQTYPRPHMSNEDRHSFLSQHLDWEAHKFGGNPSKSVIFNANSSIQHHSNRTDQKNRTRISDIDLKSNSLRNLLCTTQSSFHNNQVSCPSGRKIQEAHDGIRNSSSQLSNILCEPPLILLGGQSRCHTTCRALEVNGMPKIALAKCSKSLLHRIHKLEANPQHISKHHLSTSGLAEGVSNGPHQIKTSKILSSDHSVDVDIIRYGYPGNDEEALQCLLDTPGMSDDNLELLKTSLLRRLTEVRSKASQFTKEVSDSLGPELFFPMNKVDERMEQVVLKFCEARKVIIKKFRGYVRNRKWIENVATRQRRGCLTHKQNNVLRLWLFSNFDNPYPENEDKENLTKQTSLSLTQINNWLINARSRVWKPTVDSLSGDGVRKELVRKLNQHKVSCNR